MSESSMAAQMLNGHFFSDQLFSRSDTFTDTGAQYPPLSPLLSLPHRRPPRKTGHSDRYGRRVQPQSLGSGGDPRAVWVGSAPSETLTGGHRCAQSSPSGNTDMLSFSHKKSNSSPAPFSRQQPSELSLNSQR